MSHKREEKENRTEADIFDIVVYFDPIFQREWPVLIFISGLSPILFASYTERYIILINKEIPKVTYYYVLILNLNLKCIKKILKVISISKEYFI